MRLPVFADTKPHDLVRLAVVASLIIALPLVLADPFFVLLLQTLAYLFIVTLGLDILVGWTGQISLGHAGIYAIGAYTTALLSTRLGWPFWMTAPVGVLLSGAVGAILALPALRTKGPYLAMVTIAFGFMIEITANRWSFTGGPMGVSGIPTASLPGMPELSQTEYFWLIGFTALACQLVANNLLTSRVGRTLLALRGSEIAAQSVGINVYRWKVFAFVLSSIYAGIGGVFFAHQNGFINSDTFVFSLSVSLLASVLIGGTGKLYGPLVGSVILNLLPTLFAPLHEYHLYVTGGIILVTIVFFPEGIVGTLMKTRLFARLRRARDPVPAPSGAPEVARPPDTSRPVLSVRNIARHFGGIRALDGVSVDVKARTVHGLIGPNGSGKSTFVNVLAGLYVPTAGAVELNGTSIAGLPCHRIAALGLTRTFQTIRLFGDLTVLENVLVGFHLYYRVGLAAHAVRTRSVIDEDDELRARAMALLALVGIAERAEEVASSLPYGQQRLLEIARALAVRPAVLVLDEPAAGVNATEVQALCAIIERIEAAGVTVIVIEHHMDLIMKVCKTVTVLDFGKKIAEGSVMQIRRDPKVIEAYLGSLDTPGVRDA